MTDATGTQNVCSEATALWKQSRKREALDLLGNAIRNGSLGPEECHNAGRLIGRIGLGESGTPVRALLLGQCTTSWIAKTLTAVAWGRGSSLDVREGEYDSVIQELMASVDVDRRPQVVILLPWTQRLFGGGNDRSPERRIEEECAFWKQAWDLVAERTGARILQVGYDWVVPGPQGCHLSGAPDGAVGLVRRTNEALRAALPDGSYFLDLEQVAGVLGRGRFYDPRRYYWTKQPFSEAGVHQLATHLWAGVRALMTGPKKVLVLDLDNTLWGGVAAETGPFGISLGESPDGEAYRDFQRHVKLLSQRGVILAICSKNNRSDALAPFEQNPEMALSLSDFAHIEASWEPKSEGLRRIADTLKLGLDSFVFFDDNPAEQEQIRQALPEVEVVDVPPDPAEYIRALEAGLWFEATELSADDSRRSAQYQQEAQRRDVEKSFGSLDDYLVSLKMRGSILPIDNANLQRVVQLIGKTNQFNLTTRRHSQEDVQRLLRSSDALGLVLTMQDRFGDHGLVAVMLALPMEGAPEKTLRIETWLMSCRVIGRTAEQFFFNELAASAAAVGFDCLAGEFIPTAKNAVVADLYDRLGFSRVTEGADGAVTYRYCLKTALPAKTFVQGAVFAHA